VTVLQRKASMQQLGLPISARLPAIKGCIYINTNDVYILTHFLTSQPALIKLDNENNCGHLTPLHLISCNSDFVILENVAFLSYVRSACHFLRAVAQHSYAQRYYSYKRVRPSVTRWH